MAGPRPPIKKFRVVAGGKIAYLYGDEDLFNDYFPTATLVEEEAHTTYDTIVPSSQRRRYPGDTNPYTVGQHQMTVLDANGKNGLATPGRRAYIEYQSFGVGENVTKVRQFTFVGPFTALLNAATDASATRDFVLRSPNGVAHKIKNSA